MKSKVTIIDVAKEAKVSAQTVSRVLNNKGKIRPSTRTLVEEVIQRLGYRPNNIARGLVTDRTMTFGLVVPDIANPFFPEIASGAENAARKLGYTLFLCNTLENPEREEEVLITLAGRHIDGLILCGSRLPDHRLHPLLKEFSAAVLVYRPAPNELAGSILVDDTQGMQQVITHLLARGRKKLAFLAGPPTSYSSLARIRGFSAALEGAGRKVDTSLIVHCPPSIHGGYEIARNLLNREPGVDAIVCYNDLIAIGSLQAAAELNIAVPTSLAVVGYDDIILAPMAVPPLTTLRVAKREIGSIAIDFLLQRIEGKSENGNIIIHPELIIRQSAP